MHWSAFPHYPSHQLHELRGNSDVIVRSGTSPSFCSPKGHPVFALCERKNETQSASTMLPQAKRRLCAAPRNSCKLLGLS